MQKGKHQPSFLPAAIAGHKLVRVVVVLAGSLHYLSFYRTLVTGLLDIFGIRILWKHHLAAKLNSFETFLAFNNFRLFSSSFGN